ncbi:HK97 family phage prohead protease [Allorhizobium undicola]|uniref:hypothetical protein n=1 Tax=Allorhizobium undicola TaxID=78527 RepID=UPI00048251C3|nr:hypothetical protein [Allorhizobium undicola]
MASKSLKLRSSEERQFRTFAGKPSSVDVDAGTFEIIVTTEHPVYTWVPDPNGIPDSDGWMPCVEMLEVLPAATMDYSRVDRMPLLDNHRNTSIDDILGKIENVWAEGTSVIAKASFTPERKYLLPSIEAGYYGQVSAGYNVHEYEYIQEPGMPMIARATSWTLHEASLVTVGADPNASVRSKFKVDQPGKRSADPSQSKETRMELEELVKAAEDAITAADTAIAAVVTAADESASEEVIERAKAIRARAEEAVADAEKDKEPEAGAKADEPSEEDKKEAAEMERMRGIAQGMGFAETFERLRAIGSKSDKVRAAIEAEIIRNGVVGTRSQGQSQADDAQPRKRSDAAPVAIRMY